MKTKNQLLEEIKQIEEQEKQKNLQYLLEQFKKLEETVMASENTQNISYILFNGSKRTDEKIHINKRQISINYSKTPRSDKKYHFVQYGIALTHFIGWGEEFEITNTYSYARPAKITREQFNSLWDILSQKVKIVTHKIKEQFSAPIISQNPQNNNESIAIDLPHIVFPVYLVRFLNECPFVLNDNILLKSPNSINWMKQKIAHEREVLGCGLGLYESCDMDYVNRQFEHFNEIENLLKT